MQRIKGGSKKTVGKSVGVMFSLRGAVGQGGCRRMKGLIALELLRWGTVCCRRNCGLRRRRRRRLLRRLWATFGGEFDAGRKSSFRTGIKTGGCRYRIQTRLQSLPNCLPVQVQELSYRFLKMRPDARGGPSRNPDVMARLSNVNVVLSSLIYTAFKYWRVMSVQRLAARGIRVSVCCEGMGCDLQVSLAEKRWKENENVSFTCGQSLRG